MSRNRIEGSADGLDLSVLSSLHILRCCLTPHGTLTPPGISRSCHLACDGFTARTLTWQKYHYLHRLSSPCISVCASCRSCCSHGSRGSHVTHTDGNVKDMSVFSFQGSLWGFSEIPLYYLRKVKGCFMKVFSENRRIFSQIAQIDRYQFSCFD